jgi:EmrB/QacA subfamily drug resistance transporter
MVNRAVHCVAWNLGGKEIFVSRRTLVIVAGIMLSLFMASMEATVIATAMPTIAAQLGGLDIYSWAFSAYMLMSTCTVPVYGKLSDIYGRRIIYAVAMSLFLIGSILCGFSQSMEQLIFFRAIQGIGAGGVMPLAFIIIGDIFTFEQRARMQGFFAGVWGVSSIIGPVLGGFLVDQASWHWVFFVNILPGIVAFALVWIALQDTITRKEGVAIDYLGAAILMVGVILLLLGLNELGNPLGIGLVAVAVTLFVALWFVERRAADPVLPLGLYRNRLFVTATLHGLFSGWAMFGSLSYVPLFVQLVMGGTATEAGTTITPMMLGWVLASVVGGRLLLRIGYRTLALVGMVLLTLGAFLVSQIGTDATRYEAMVYLTMMGIGMGFSVPSFLIAVQSSVAKRSLGTATSTLQFSRSIGGTLGVSIMGVFLTLRLTNALVAAGLDPNVISLDSMVEQAESAAVTVTGPMRDAVAIAIEGVFILAFIAAALGLIATAFAPSGRIGQLNKQPAPDEGSAPVADLAPEL